MSTYPPLPGSPQVVEALAAALAQEAGRIGAAHTVLLAIRAGAVWDSPAGAAFEERVQRLPRVLDAVARRYAGSAAVLHGFAAELRDAQAQCAAAIRLREEGAAVRDRFGERLVLAEQSGSPVELLEVPHLRARMAAGAQQVLAAEQGYRHARERFEAADRRCAQSLRALGEDSLGDPWHYDALNVGVTASRAVSATAGWAAAVPSPFSAQLAGVSLSAAASGLALEAGVMAAYGDGDLRELAGAAGAFAAARVSAGLAHGARAGAAGGAGVRGPSAYLTPGQRFTIGFTSQVQAFAGKAPVNAARARGGTAARPTYRRGVRGHVDRGRDLLVARARRAVLDDLAIATRNGPVAQRMMLSSKAIDAGLGARRGAENIERVSDLVRSDPGGDPHRR